MKRRIIIYLCAICAIASAHAQQLKFDDIQMRKLILSMYNIKDTYVDTVSEKKLVEDAIVGVLKELDPHSQYTPAKDVQALNEPLLGSFDGIGVQYNMDEDTLVVIQPTSGGPSEKVGIIAGDKIVTVNDTSIAGVKMSRTDIMKRLRGPKGTQVKLGIIRQGIAGLQYFTVTRDKIPLYTLDAYYMIDETTGYIRISSFGATTFDEFKSAVKNLREEQKYKIANNTSNARQPFNLIIDLQGNGGGYLQAAVDLCDEFFSNGEMLVYTEGRAVGRHEYHAKSGKMDIDKVVVLVDGYSASAAEIFSGAIQDNDRGLIVGRRTFGKGLVQRQINLPDGSLIRLTMAHYYSPVGRCFQKPYVKGDKKKYDHDMLDRLSSGELMSADSIHFPDSLKYTTKGGRTVYGGGGVMPDIYVPLDTTLYTRMHRELSAKSCIIQTTIKYLDSHRKKLTKQYNIEAYRKARASRLEGKKYDIHALLQGFDRFNKEFEIPQEMIDLLLKKAEDAKITYTDSALQATLPMVKLQLKALLARDLWDMNEYFKIMNTNSEIYNSGLKALKEE